MFTGDAGHFFGTSVAINAGVSDCIAVVGTPGKDTGRGGVILFQRSQGASSFSKSDKTLVYPGDGGSFGTDAALGTSVAISNDGNVIAAGGPGAFSGAGVVLIFFKLFPSVSFFSSTPQLSRPLGGPNLFGKSLALSGNGKILIVGAPGDIDGGLGAAFVFIRTTLTSSSWVLHSVLNDTNGEGGWSVACNSNCSIVAMGAPSSNGMGAVLIYTRDAITGAFNSPQTLSGVSEFTSGRFGTAVTLNDAGDVLMVSEFVDSTSSGVVYSFTRSGDDPNFHPADRISAPPLDSSTGFGFSIDLSGDGMYGIVGGPNVDNDFGGVWLIGTVSSDGTYGVQTRMVAKPNNPNGPTNFGTKFGNSVSCSGGGETCIVGAPFDTNGAGSIYFLSLEAFETATGDFPLAIIIPSILGACLIAMVLIVFARNARLNAKQRKGGFALQNDGLIEIADFNNAILRPTYWSRAYLTSSIRSLLSRRIRRYAVFISYHQESASSDANALYEHLLKIGFASDQIFLDKTNLSSLEEVVASVRNSAVLLQLQSHGLFYSPFCLIEAFTALQSGVNIVPVFLDGYNFQDTLRLKSATSIAVEIERVRPGMRAVLEQNGFNPESLLMTVLNEVSNMVSLPYKSSERELVRDAMFVEIVRTLFRSMASFPLNSGTVSQSLMKQSAKVAKAHEALPAIKAYYDDI